MRGRKPVLTANQIFEKLIHFEIFNGLNLKKGRDPVWVEICKALSEYGDIKPTNLYLMLKQDRNSLMTRYKKDKFIKEGILLDADNVLNPNPEEEDESEEEIKEPKVMKRKKKLLQFQVELQPNEWERIKPEEKLLKDGRQSKVLKPGWTNIFVKAMLKVQKLPCIFKFKRHAVNVEDAFVKIIGYCKKCQATLVAKCYEVPKINGSANFFIKTKNFKYILHFGPRLAGPERNKVRKVEQARQDTVNKDLNIQKGVGLFESLANLEKNILYFKYMKQIGFGINSFYLMYWSAEQINIHNDIQQLTDNHLSIATSGFLTDKVSLPDGNSQHVFLTVLLNNIKNQIVPLAQVLSKQDDTNFLKYWLIDWLRSGAKTPKRIILDRIKPLLNVVSYTFNNMSYSEYNNCCLRILLGSESQEKINTQINVDIAPLISSVTRWKCFDKTPSNVKEFYLRCIGFMSTLTNLDNFQYFLKSVSTVAQTKYCNHACITCVILIAGTVKNFEMPKITSNSEKEEICQHAVLEEVNEMNGSLMSRFIADIMETTEPNRMEGLANKFLNSNDFYLPEILKPLSNLCEEFLCWTNVMNITFNNSYALATSARSELYFRDLKSTLLQDHLPKREDKIFAEHCKKIESDMVIIRSEVENLQAESIKNNC